MNTVEIARFDGLKNAIKSDFVERVATPKRVMKLGIHLPLIESSLFNTVSILASFGVNRARSTVHNWVQKADPEPRAGRDFDKFALDESVLKVNGERFWLYAAVNPETNVILHVRLYPTRIIVVTKLILREL